MPYFTFSKTGHHKFINIFNKRVTEEKPGQQVGLKLIVSLLTGLKLIKSERADWVAGLHRSPTSHCRASGCRSYETSYPPAWHLCLLSSPWQHGGEAQTGGGVPANKGRGKQKKGRVRNEEKSNRDLVLIIPSRVVSFWLRIEWWTFFFLLLASSPTHQPLLSPVTTVAVHWRHPATCGIQWSGSG